MKRIKNKSLIIMMAFAMLVNYILPINIVFASVPDNSNSYGMVQINGATSLENKNNSNEVIATFDEGTLRISGTGLYSDGNNMVYVPNSGDVTLDANANAGTASLIINGNNSNGSTETLHACTPGSISIVNVNFGNGNNNPQQPTGNTESNVVVSAGVGTYDISVINPNTHTAEIKTVNYDDEVHLRINGSEWDPEQSTISYDSNESTVVFTFETLWINRYYEDIVINGTTYEIDDYIDFDDRDSWLMHNNGSQLVSFSITNVPKADTYNIVAKHGRNNGTPYLSTFLWTADPAQSNGENYIGHSKLEFVKAVYEVGGVTYTTTEEDIAENKSTNGDHYSFKSADGFLDYGVLKDVDFDDGSLTVPGETEITMRVVPEYGYQVTSVNGGSNFTTTEDGVSEFTITLHNGEAGYFRAEVTKVDDEVKANSDKVASGKIEIGNNVIDSGTVVLSVDDADINEDKIKDFEKVAGDYKISNYLDINLNQVLYKGTADDVWSNQIHHLDEEVTISLKLEDGVDASSIVIVHNIDDGDEFEIIEIESYDPKTNTITFKTKSFSNYAIAAKTEVASTSNPKTGDNIDTYFIMLIAGIVGLLFVSLVAIKRKKNKNLS